MGLYTLNIFVSLCILKVFVISNALSGNDPKRRFTDLVTRSTDTDHRGLLYQPNVIFNPPACSDDSESSCDCTTIQALMSAELKHTKLQLEQFQAEVSEELEDTKRQLEQFQDEVSKELEDTKRQLEQFQAEVSKELEDTKHQLKQIHEAVLDLGEIVKNSSDDSPLRDCSEVLASGVYTIQPAFNGQKIKVYCDMETDGGGWTVFQRRQDGTVDFYRSFDDYSQGFGDLEGEFWLGNEHLHQLTSRKEYELRVDLTDFEDDSAYAVYDSFRVGDLADNYRLSVEGYSGTAGDSLSYHHDMQFTAKDRDNDSTGDNCAQSFHGAWWYKSCYYSNLNGDYVGEADSTSGIVWKIWHSGHYSLKTSEMKIRLKG